MFCFLSEIAADEGIKYIDPNEVESFEKHLEENVNFSRWQKAANIKRCASLLKALVAIIWDKLLSFKNLTKLGKEHKLLELLVTATREEVESKGTFMCLITIISEEKRRKKKFEDIMRHTFETGKRIFELSRQCTQMARERRQNWETHNEIVGILKISQKKLKYKAFVKLS